ncbi:MAG: YceI family protein, partial [Lutibacter sp.]
MKKIFFLLLIISTFNTVRSQNKYYTKNGEISFEASVPSFEEVKAENNSVTAILDVSKNEFAALALIKGFRFKVALMEEHFNENYMESDDYPKAIFKGKLKNFNIDKLSEKPQKATIKGTLTIRNKEKPIEAEALISKEKNTLILTSNFKVQPSDFNIKIPSIVSEKIAKE